jgi:uncharacterized membrane protein
MAKGANTTDLLVVSFKREETVDEFIEALRDLNKQKLVQTKGIAKVTRKGLLGDIDIEDKSDKIGVGIGALAGGLMGALSGKGAMGGAVKGGVAGGAVDLVTDFGFDDDFLKQVGKGLKNNSAACVAVVHFKDPEQSITILDRFSGGALVRSNLPDEIAARLDAAIQS